MAKKLTFEVLGPYDVPTIPEARVITKDEGRSFFREYPHLRGRVGAYVFGVRSGGGITPVYVGKSTRPYESECFTADKALKYTIGLSQYEKGTPILFFVSSPKERGRPNAKLIGDLEDFLIQNAKSRNEDLVNKIGANEANWSIRGVLRSTSQGQPPKPAREFRRMMGFGKSH